jgi:4-hydroxybenzoate polyprenyltransferase
MIKEYLKLARSFNAVLTGISPVMGAISMEQYDLITLFILFLIGFFGHTYGFVLNDIIDYEVDKTSKDIRDRPLISGTISIKKAWIFAILSMILSFSFAVYLSYSTSNYFPILLLIGSAFFITLYDMVSKKLLGSDIFVAIGVFLLILYGASITVENISYITRFSWIVCILGSIQVLFMQFIAGGLKDIENDFINKAKTIAMKMGVRIQKKELIVTPSFKCLAYGLQLLDMIVVFLPFFIIWDIKNLEFIQYLQGTIIVFIGIIMFYLSSKLLNMKKFDRRKVRKYIGSHYVINFTIVPIMLMKLNPWTGLLIFLPSLGFILSNIILHGTIAQPKTM